MGTFPNGQAYQAVCRDGYQDEPVVSVQLMGPAEANGWRGEWKILTREEAILRHRDLQKFWAEKRQARINDIAHIQLQLGAITKRDDEVLREALGNLPTSQRHRLMRVILETLSGE